MSSYCDFPFSMQLFSAPPVNLLYVGVGNQGAAVTHWLLSSNQNICLPSPSSKFQIIIPSSSMKRKSNKLNLCMNFPFSSVVCSSDLETSSIKSDVQTTSLLILRQETTGKQTSGESINSSLYAFLLGQMTIMRIYFLFS